MKANVHRKPLFFLSLSFTLFLSLAFSLSLPLQGRMKEQVSQQLAPLSNNLVNPMVPTLSIRRGKIVPPSERTSALESCRETYWMLRKERKRRAGGRGYLFSLLPCGGQKKDRGPRYRGSA